MKRKLSNFLIICNGSEENLPALEYGVLLAQALGASVDLLGIIESNDRQQAVNQQLEDAAANLSETGVDFTSETTRGHVRDVLDRLSDIEKHDLLVFGPLGRPPLRRWLRGRSFRRILSEIGVPILYVPEVRWPIKSALVCLGGLGYSLTAENHGLQIARSVNAAFTLLHVVPPIDLDYPVAREIQDNWKHLSDTDTLPGKSIRQAVALASSLGLKANVRVLHGHIVEEVLKEIKQGDYDLVCMGSPYSSHSLLHLYTPNVTAEVAETAHIPILSARFEA